MLYHVGMTQHLKQLMKKLLSMEIMVRKECMRVLWNLSNMQQLKETIYFMKSSDYKERFIAEYWQTKIRYEKLKDYCNSIEAAMMVEDAPIPVHDCPLNLLREQQSAMGKYLHILELRAKIEKIDLEAIINVGSEPLNCKI